MLGLCRTKQEFWRVHRLLIAFGARSSTVTGISWVDNQMTLQNGWKHKVKWNVEAFNLINYAGGFATEKWSCKFFKNRGKVKWWQGKKVEIGIFATSFENR